MDSMEGFLSSFFFFWGVYTCSFIRIDRRTVDIYIYVYI